MVVAEPLEQPVALSLSLTGSFTSANGRSTSWAASSSSSSQRTSAKPWCRGRSRARRRRPPIAPASATTRWLADTARRTPRRWRRTAARPGGRYRAGDAPWRGVAGDVVVALEAVDRPGRRRRDAPAAGREVQQGQTDGDEDALDHPEDGRHPGSRRWKGRTPSCACGQLAHALGLDQPDRGGDHDGGQRGVGQIPDQVREQQQQERDRQPRRPARSAASCRRPRRPASGRSCWRPRTLEEAGGDVSPAERDQLLARVDLEAAADREGPREHAGVGERDQGDPDGAGREGRKLVGREAGDRE